MPSPLPEALRERVMHRLEKGQSVGQVAQALALSRMTVYRYRQAAQEQGQRVPVPRVPRKKSRKTLDKKETKALAELALQHPKDTALELRERLNLQVSESTVRRALKEAGIRHKRAHFRDLRIRTDEGIVWERRAFRQAQRGPALLASRLLFFDEANFRLNEQATRGWAAPGASHAELFRPKGHSVTTGVFLTLGQGGVLHHRVYPPARPFQALPLVYEAQELPTPGRGIPLDQDLKEASVGQLRHILRTFGVKVTDTEGRPLKKRRLLTLARHLERRGQVGLPRAGRKDLGGGLQAFRATTRDVVQYWLKHFLPWAGEQKLDLRERTLVWDNAATHGAVRTTQTQNISVFHRWFREWGLAGVVFTPPRSPSFNPVELCFAYVKRWVRKWAPPEGYTQAGLEQAIAQAVEKVTPQMIDNWIRACGYHEEQREQEVLARDCNFRWAGYGSRPVNTLEQEPEVGFLRDDVYEPLSIVDERVRGGRKEYRIRWKGYAPAEDTWEPRSHLLVGAHQLLRNWERTKTVTTVLT